MERHLNVSALGMRVSLIKPELPSLHIHSERDRRAGSGGGGSKVFKCQREVPGCRHMLQKQCAWGGGWGHLLMTVGLGQAGGDTREKLQHWSINILG